MLFLPVRIKRSGSGRLWVSKYFENCFCVSFPLRFDLPDCDRDFALVSVPGFSLGLNFDSISRLIARMISSRPP